MTYKLDIFKLLSLIDSSKSDIYSALSEDEKKGFFPLIVQRWLSGTSDQQQIMLLNEFVNPYLFLLGKHPHLLMLLLQAASTKVNKRYSWLSNKSTKNRLSLRVVEDYYDMTPKDVRELNPFPIQEEVLQMAELLGWDKSEIAKLKKEHVTAKQSKTSKS